MRNLMIAGSIVGTLFSVGTASADPHGRPCAGEVQSNITTYDTPYAYNQSAYGAPVVVQPTRFIAPPPPAPFIYPRPVVYGRGPVYYRGGYRQPVRYVSAPYHGTWHRR